MLAAACCLLVPGTRDNAVVAQPAPAPAPAAPAPAPAPPAPAAPTAQPNAPAAPTAPGQPAAQPAPTPAQPAPGQPAAQPAPAGQPAPNPAPGTTLTPATSAPANTEPANWTKGFSPRDQRLPAAGMSGRYRPMFGTAYFGPTREIIQARRDALKAWRDGRGQAPSATNPAGSDANAYLFATGDPVQAILGQIQMTTPQRYQLSAGDRLTLRTWSETSAPVEDQMTVDQTGGIVLPGGGRLIVRGLTLGQAETTVLKRMRAVVRDAQVSLTLRDLRTMQITVLGASYYPGTYNVSAAATFFNMVYATGGPADGNANSDAGALSPGGTLRGIELRRGGAVIATVDMYRFLLTGDKSADIPLQAGDVIYFPLGNSRVEVRGEVGMEMAYELVKGETLQDALRYAGGVRATGVATRIQVTTLKPGDARIVRDIDATTLGSGPAVQLYDGDVVQIFRVQDIATNKVTIKGAVDQQGEYALTPGMTVAELLRKARGLSPEAYTKRADLSRVNADNSATLIPIDLTRAMAGDPTANVRLQRWDEIKVYRQDEAVWAPSLTITVAGAVARAGLHPYYRDMRVTDLILHAGGLTPDAHQNRADIRRLNQDGTTALLTLDLEKAIAGDRTQDMALKPGDELKVYSKSDLEWTLDRTVWVEGAVKALRTGDARQGEAKFPRSDNMRIRDLMIMAGGPAPDAYVERAALRHQKRLGPGDPAGAAPGVQVPAYAYTYEYVDLNLAARDDPRHNLPLQDGDHLQVFTKSEMIFTPEHAIAVRGYVVTEFTREGRGLMKRGEGMLLSHALKLAGGVTPAAGAQVQVAHARSDRERPPTVCRLVTPDGTVTPDPALEDGDTILVQGRGEYQELPRVVTIVGAVNRPGPVVLTGDIRRLADAIKQAGGLRPEAFSRGVEFIRAADLMSPEQTKIAAFVNTLSNATNDDEFRRQQAVSVVSQLSAINSTSKSSSSSIPYVGATSSDSGGGSGGNVLDALYAKIARSDLVTKARDVSADLQPRGNVFVDLSAALRKPGGDDDILMQDGDVVRVPETPTTVQVIGAVVHPRPVVYRPGAGVRYYTDLAGGLAPDARLDRAIVIRSGGGLTPLQRVKALERGDVILVPTRVVAQRIGSRTAEIDRLVQSFGATTIVVLAARKLLGL